MKFVPSRITRVLKRRALIRKEKAQIKSSEVCIVSYPKCGRTWLRVMLGKAIYSRFELQNPEYLFLTSQLTEHVGIGPLCITHGHAEKQLSSEAAIRRLYSGKKVILLTRDIRDIVVSAYHHYAFRYGTWKGSISEFLSSEYGVQNIIDYYSAWHCSRDVLTQCLVVRYEQMHENPVDVLRAVLQFLGVPSIPDMVLEEAVAYASFEHMQQMEKMGTYPANELKPRNSGDNNGLKARKGKIGGYVDHLSGSESEYILESVCRCPELEEWLIWQ